LALIDLWMKEQTPPTLPREQSLRKHTKLGGVISESNVSEVSQVSAKLMICGDVSLIKTSSSPSLFGKLQQFSNTHLRTASDLESLFNEDSRAGGSETVGRSLAAGDIG
jgi:hypothetical protein